MKARTLILFPTFYNDLNAKFEKWVKNEHHTINKGIILIINPFILFIKGALICLLHKK